MLFDVTGALARLSEKFNWEIANMHKQNELDPNGYSPHTPGAKNDHGKPPVGMIFEYFPRALLAVAEVAGHGAEKYTRGGWLQVPNGQERYDDALGRHLLYRHIDGDLDPVSDLLHLAHSAWNALAILELKMREKYGDAV